MRIAHVLSIATFGPTSFGLGLGLGLGLLSAGPGCKVQSIFTCVDNTNCEKHGEGGVCEANSFCTFPDASCPTGKRWHDRAGDLGGECFEIDGGSGSGSGDAGSGSSDGASADDDGSGSSTAPMTTADSSSGEPPDPSTGPGPSDGSSGGGSGSTGAAGACDAQYGGATDYMFCEETADSCTFSTTIAMMMSCAEVCTSFAGTCITAYDNDVDLCTAGAEVGCDAAATNDTLCVCSNGA